MRNRTGKTRRRYADPLGGRMNGVSQTSCSTPRAWRLLLSSHLRRERLVSRWPLPHRSLNLFSPSSVPAAVWSMHAWCAYRLESCRVFSPPHGFVDRGGPTDAFAAHAVRFVVLLINAMMTCTKSKRTFYYKKSHVGARVAKCCHEKAVSRRRNGCCFLKPPKGSVLVELFAKKCQETHVLI